MCKSFRSTWHTNCVLIFSHIDFLPAPTSAPHPIHLTLYINLSAQYANGLVSFSLIRTACFSHQPVQHGSLQSNLKCALNICIAPWDWARASGRDISIVLPTPVSLPRQTTFAIIIKDIIALSSDASLYC